MLKAVLVKAGREPEVIEVLSNLDDYYRVIEENLSDEERKKNPTVTGVDFFGVGIPNVSGMVEDFSACHPYERNRDWHGPALFTEYNEDGETVSMSEENIALLMDMFSLSNTPKSDSDYINLFLDNYAKPEIHSYEYKGNFATMNTMDAVSVILREKDPSEIKVIEGIFNDILEIAFTTGQSVSHVLSGFLKKLNEDMFIQQVESMGFMF